MEYVIASVFPIFLIMLAGKVIKTQWLTAEEFWRGLERLSYFLLFPVVLFNYISTANLSANELLKLVLALMTASTIIGAGLILYQKRTNCEGRLFTSIFQGGIRYNSYIFFGLGDTLYGKEGMVIVAVISAYMIIFTNIFCVLIFTWYAPSENDKLHLSKSSSHFSQWRVLFKNLAVNPLIISSLLGFLFNYFDISLSLTFEKSLQSLSDSALAMGLLCVGAGLKFQLNKNYLPCVLLTCLAKLIALPTLTFVIFKILGIKGLAKSVGILYSCLPTATNSFLLSKQLGGDSDSMASIITFSIIFSVLSLTLLTYILA